MAAEFMQELACPACATTGHATWEAGEHTRRRLTSISDSFQLAPQTAPDSAAAIVCAACGTIQP